MIAVLLLIVGSLILAAGIAGIAVAWKAWRALERIDARLAMLIVTPPSLSTPILGAEPVFCSRCPAGSSPLTSYRTDHDGSVVCLDCHHEEIAQK